MTDQGHSRRCDRFQERLPLLRYPGELTEVERRQVLAHLEGCAACSHVQAGFEAAADSLDELPLDLPSAERLAALRANVLSAVGANSCAREIDLIEPTPDLGAHLVSCEPCRGLSHHMELIVGLLGQQAPAPSLDAQQQARLREGVLASTGLALRCAHEHATAAGESPAEHVAACAPCQELAAVQRAVDLVDDAVPEAPRAPADVRAAILARLEINLEVSDAEVAEAAARVGPALDLVELPALTTEQSAGLTARVLAATGATVATDVVSGAELEEVSEGVSEDAREGRLLRFPGWVARAAAALLLTGTVGLGYVLQKGPWVPTDPAGNLAQLLEREAELAEKLARASGDAPRSSVTVLERAEQHFAGVLEQASPRLADPRVKNVALRAKSQLLALRLVTSAARKGSTAAAATDPKVRQAPTEQSLLISYGDVIRDYPDSLATLWVLKRFPRGPLRYDLRRVRPANEKLAEFLKATRSRSRRGMLRDDYADLSQLVSVGVQDVSVRQAILLQQGIHAQELGNAADAERHYRDAIAIDPATRAGGLAQDRLDSLTVM